MTDITLGAEAWAGVEPGVEALVDRWLVAEGDTVRAGQVIANVVLVKTNQDIVTPRAGRIDKILVRADETFAQGTPIAVLS